MKRGSAARANQIKQQNAGGRPGATELLEDMPGAADDEKENVKFKSSFCKWPPPMLPRVRMRPPGGPRVFLGINNSVKTNPWTTMETAVGLVVRRAVRTIVWKTVFTEGRETITTDDEWAPGQAAK